MASRQSQLPSLRSPLSRRFSKPSWIEPIDPEWRPWRPDLRRVFVSKDADRRIDGPSLKVGRCSRFVSAQTEWSESMAHRRQVWIQSQAVAVLRFLANDHTS